MKKVIYTAIFGSKDDLLEPLVKPSGFDFICFTDSDIKSETWEVRRVLPKLEDSVREARRYKILVHDLFPDYDISIWVDGNMLIKGDLNNLVDEYLRDCNLALFDHSQNTDDPIDCIYNEAEHLINLNNKGKYKDNSDLIMNQVETYRRLGYPANNGAGMTSVLIRRHMSLDIIKCMNDWWSELSNHSRRDQLSFNFIAWKNKLRFRFIDGDSRDNDYFKRLPHKVRKYWDSPK